MESWSNSGLSDSEEYDSSWMDDWLSFPNDSVSLTSGGLVQDDIYYADRGPEPEYDDIPLILDVGTDQDNKTTPCNHGPPMNPQVIMPEIVIGDDSPENGVHDHGLRPVESGENCCSGATKEDDKIKIPYLDNPIIDHQINLNGQPRYLVWMSEAKMTMIAPRWIDWYWKARDLLQNASGITQSKASLPKWRREDERL
ncbi:hypothetical protein BGW36DRAFT_21905 [Talaromyces proteolyticus]|uniref:Uncharacterized protein n=1 Tax=Talaromyces proteolyticus TaxID=1131652 RepID=A0AAD4L542_9EURO|nr:uncharacterized protein BGW36DRAFT_21905 [Talaromyces proteolyticus]KAH8706058.1 hypothetical protein BGW36DRAFT_21905 [Talaromyces proteolyticus]